MKTKFDVIGMNKIHTIEYTNSHDHENYYFTDVRYEIFLKDKKDNKYVVHLNTIHGDCYSGYTTATWGNILLLRISNIGTLTHKVKEPLQIDLFKSDSDDLYEVNDKFIEEEYNSVFSYSYTGGDDWYPYGSVEVNEDLFISTGRGHNVPVKWIFSGDSNLGKSYISSRISEYSQIAIYETDCSDKLEDNVLACDIICIGNKYKFTPEQIKEFVKSKGIEDVKYIEVNFKEVD